MKKKLSVTFLLSSFFLFSTAQVIEDAKQNIYYKKYQTAKNILQSAISKADASPDAYYWLSQIYLAQNNIDSASYVLKNTPNNLLEQQSLKKENPLFFIGWAHILLKSGKTAEARTQFQEILELTKYKYAEALLATARANIENEQGDVPWAIELLNKAIKRDKKNPKIYSALGDAYRKLVDGGAAITNFDNALEVEPGFAEAAFKEGLIYKTQQNDEIFLEKFNKAYAIDSNYLPAIYELYNYYFFKDVKQADTFLNAYIRHADPDPKHAYMKTDLEYVSRKYNEAIESSKAILRAEGDSVQPRLYKLLAYSYAAIGDSSTALDQINKYFVKQADSETVSKDYGLKADLLKKISTDKSVAVEWYRKAVAADTSKKESLDYMVSLAELQKDLGNREREALWRERIFAIKDHPTNLDIYKWGMALYFGENYEKADSVFSIYEQKYPDQVHGYLMRAKVNALIDTTMEKGLAVPHYQKLAEVAAKDSAKNETLLLTAYQYLGAYEATVTKNYNASLEYYDKVLSIKPDDPDAEKNVKILSKWIADGKGEGGSN